jgi:hypothetical protein
MINYFRAALLIFSVIFSLGDAVAEPLITKEEAGRPNQDIGAIGSRAISPGPTIRLISPSAKDLDTRTVEASDIQSPFKLQLEFQPHGGSSIDWNTFKVTYLKTPEATLTARLIPYKTNNGILFASAEVPPGVHLIKVEVSDSDRIPSWKIIKLAVKAP